MLDFTQIQHYNRHGKRKTYGLRQFRFHFSKVAFAFCKMCIRDRPQTIEPAAVQKVDAIQASQNNCEACAQCQQLCASGMQPAQMCIRDRF